MSAHEILIFMPTPLATRVYRLVTKDSVEHKVHAAEKSDKKLQNISIQLFFVAISSDCKVCN